MEKGAWHVSDPFPRFPAFPRGEELHPKYLLVFPRAQFRGPESMPGKSGEYTHSHGHTHRHTLLHGHHTQTQKTHTHRHIHSHGHTYSDTHPHTHTHSQTHTEQIMEVRELKKQLGVCGSAGCAGSRGGKRQSLRVTGDKVRRLPCHHVLSPRLAAEDREDTAGGECDTNDTQQQSQAGLCPSDTALKDMCWAWHRTQSALGDGSTQLQSSGQPGGHPCGSNQAGPRSQSWNSVPVLLMPWLSSGYSQRGTISLTHLVSSTLQRPLELPWKIILKPPGYAYSLSRV